MVLASFFGRRDRQEFNVGALYRDQSQNPGWGFPFAGLALAATAGYYGSCWRWDGFQWVNVCYRPYYGYAPYSYVGYSTYW
jgi:hypothetical protein